MCTERIISKLLGVSADDMQSNDEIPEHNEDHHQQVDIEAPLKRSISIDKSEEDKETTGNFEKTVPSIFENPHLMRALKLRTPKRSYKQSKLEKTLSRNASNNKVEKKLRKKVRIEGLLSIQQWIKLRSSHLVYSGVLICHYLLMFKIQNRTFDNFFLLKISIFQT